MRVGCLGKRLSVFGDRYWKKGFWRIKMTKPAPFGKMPLRYERAFGGWDQTSDNPKNHSWEPRKAILNSACPLSN